MEGFSLDDAGILAEIKTLHDRQGYLADPHTAVGIAAARSVAAAPVVVAGTAHPAKFPDAIERAAGFRPTLPPRLADLFDRAETCETLPNDLRVVEAAVRRLALRNAA
jgi:threonine synthase